MSNKTNPIHYCEDNKSYGACGKRVVRASSNWANVNCKRCLAIKRIQNTPVIKGME